MSHPTRALAAFCAALLLAVVTTAPAPGQPPPQRPAHPPNVILIVADDLGWNAVGYHGGFVKTPNIDRIARSGVELDRFYVSPMCSPTRASLMTGRYPLRFGMGRSVVRPWAKFGLPPEERTLPEALAGAGYARRAAFGKWHLGHLAPEWHPLAQGFTEFKGCYNGAADYFTRVRDGEVDWHRGREPLDENGYTTDLIADAAASFVARQPKDAPFFCYVAFTAPHDPLQAPDKYLAPYAHLDRNAKDGKPSPKQLAAAMTACMDDGIGRIMTAVENAGVSRNTFVWLISDNGGVRRIPDTNAPLRAGKLTVYEGGVRVPSAVWWPGVLEGGRKITTPLAAVDVLPTVLGTCVPQLADMGAAGPLDGHNALDVLSGKAPAGDLASRDLYCFSGQEGPEAEQLAMIAPDGWKLVIAGPDVRRAGGYQTPQHRVELFHLSEDPLERTDLAAGQPERVAALAKKLVAFRRSEPAASLPPMNRKPADFRPPPHWRNPAAAAAPAAPAAAVSPAGAASRRPAARANILAIREGNWKLLVSRDGAGEITHAGPGHDRVHRCTQREVVPLVCIDHPRRERAGEPPERTEGRAGTDGRRHRGAPHDQPATVHGGDHALLRPCPEPMVPACRLARRPRRSTTKPAARMSTAADDGSGSTTRYACSCPEGWVPPPTIARPSSEMASALFSVQPRSASSSP